MKPLYLAAIIAMLQLDGSAQAAAAQAAAVPPSPGTFAVIDEGDLGYAIRHFPSRLRIYTYDLDRPGVSACTLGCASAWPPVRAEPGAQPIGDWTLVPRADGAPQWAYKGAPVYVRYHDEPDAPSGEGEQGVWRLVKHIPKTTTARAN
jgi:predicted lipoprotein with Yx(FWY)xxD motif